MEIFQFGVHIYHTDQRLCFSLHLVSKCFTQFPKNLQFYYILLKSLVNILHRYADDELWAMTVRGSAFLWHQVRCMVAVLFMIGQGLESPDVSVHIFLAIDVLVSICI